MEALFYGVSVFAMYLIPAGVIMGVARKFLKIPDELFWKIRHFLLPGAYCLFLLAFRTWWISAGFATGKKSPPFLPSPMSGRRKDSLSRVCGSRKTETFA